MGTFYTFLWLFAGLKKAPIIQQHKTGQTNSSAHWLGTFKTIVMIIKDYPGPAPNVAYVTQRKLGLKLTVLIFRQTYVNLKKI